MAVTTSERTPLRAVIVDDEPLAREGVRMLLDEDPDIEIVGEAGEGSTAIELVNRLKPNMIFLDIQLPEMNGFEVLSRIDPALHPAVVFVTAFDDYALRAFEVHALDYLLKPFSDERFFSAVRRAKDDVRLSRVSALGSKLMSLLDTYPANGSGGNGVSARTNGDGRSRIAIKSAGRVVFLETTDIDWIEAADYYVQLHVGSETFLHRQTMQSLERQLDAGRFIRIHRSAIVNIERIRELRHASRRDLYVILDNGVELRVSRSNRSRLQERIGA